MLPSSDADNHPRNVYDEALRQLAMTWRGKADEIDKQNDDDLSAGIAGGLRNCAVQLDGLVDIAQGLHGAE